MNETIKCELNKIKDENISSTIKEVAYTLEEKGYDAVNQIVGYLMSDDIGYISSYKGAREKIKKIDRTEILEVLVKGFIK